MANINSLMTNSSSSTSSLYGTRNVLSGLASGMDTEAMIENSVSGYKTKVTQLQQQQTKYEWKQDAYRSITDKLYALNETYTSYTSKTNLYSNAFFNNAVTTSVTGAAANIDKVSATGKSSSDIEILAAQTATAARYSVDASALGLKIPGSTGSALETGKVTVGALNGSMTLSYNSRTVEISFGESDTGITDVEKLKDAIVKKLGEQTISGEKASDLIGVTVSGNQIEFTDKKNSGATPYISSVSGNMTEKLGVTSATSSTTPNKPTFDPAKPLQEDKPMADYLKGKQINVTLDGVTKAISLSGLTSKAGTDGNALETSSLESALQSALDKSFGNGKITVSVTDGKLDFAVNNNSMLEVVAKDSAVGEKLGLGKSGLTNYLNAGSSLGELLGGKFSFDGADAAKAPSGVQFTAEKDATTNADSTEFFKGSDGNRYQRATENGADVYYRVNDKGDRLFELKINNESIYVSKDASLQSVLNSINSSDMGVKASYSKLTGKFVFEAKETGEANGIDFQNPLAQRLFGGSPSNQRTLGEIFGYNGDGTIHLDWSWGTNYGATKAMGDFKATDTLQDVFDRVNNNHASLGFSTYIVYDEERGVFQKGSSLSNLTDVTADNSKWKFTATIGGDTANAKSLTTTDFLMSQSALDQKRDLTYNPGTDAKIAANVNGERVDLVRSSNTIDMDGLSVNLKDSFGNVTDPSTDDAVSFNTTSDADSVVKTVKDFIESYNAILKEIHDAYATQPAEKSSSTHAKYEPLTDDDKASMSDKAVENYEAKAKQGILFGDSDLSALYSKLVSAFSTGGNVGALKDIGITTTYSGGVTQIKIEESKLRAALESDPDKVRDAFTKSKEGGASSDGLMTSIKNTLEQYASTSIASPGILVKKAGSTFSSTSLLSNAVQKQIDSVQKQIEKWQSKMSSKIDYYTRQFTALEKLMNTMNSQSSALSGLMGGY